MEKACIYLSREEVLIIHGFIIERFGGQIGIRDLGLLESALARPRAGMIDFEAYPNIFIKAAVLGHSLIKNHPFYDGNKRTGVIAIIRFLNINGLKLKLEKNELVNLALEIAGDGLDEEGVAEWLKARLGE